MKFDYIPPFIYSRIFNIRQHYIMFWAIAGLLCVIIAICANKPSLKTTTIPNTQIIASKSKTTNTNSINEPEKTKISTSKNKNLTEQILAFLPIPKNQWKTIAITQGDTLSKIFTKLELPWNTLHEILTKNPEGKKLTNLTPGQQIKFLILNNNLQSLKIPLSNTKTLIINNTEDGFKYIYNNKKIITKFVYRANSIKNSLFLSGQEVGLSDTTIMQLAEIFDCDIDFVLDLRDNDRFKILFEEDYIKGKKVKTGNILMAEFTNKNKTYRAIRFTDPDGYTAYYSPEGYKMQKFFLRTPVKFTRISSHFSNGRRHPILHKIRAHRGVDYATLHGTPIKAAGDGKVVFIGKQNGYGNAIQLQHNKKYSTFYAHLSSFSPTVKHNSYVRQGQIIGFVGKTGLASGSHLHYEFRVNGIHRNPLTVTMPKILSIDSKYKNKFLNYAKQIVSLLAEHETNYIATNG